MCIRDRATCVPIFIAVTSLLLSVFTAYHTRKSAIYSRRPFVWAASYGYIDKEAKIIQPIPYRVAFRISNSPATIAAIEISIFHSNDRLFHSKEERQVRFPDSQSEWQFGMDEATFMNLMNRENIGLLRRDVLIRYSALSGGKQYKFEMKQRYIPLDNQWQTIQEVAT